MPEIDGSSALIRFMSPNEPLGMGSRGIVDAQVLWQLATLDEVLARRCTPTVPMAAESRHRHPEPRQWPDQLATAMAFRALRPHIRLGSRQPLSVCGAANGNAERLVLDASWPRCQSFESNGRWPLTPVATRPRVVLYLLSWSLTRPRRQPEEGLSWLEQRFPA